MAHLSQQTSFSKQHVRRMYLNSPLTVVHPSRCHDRCQAVLSLSLLNPCFRDFGLSGPARPDSGAQGCRLFEVLTCVRLQGFVGAEVGRRLGGPIRGLHMLRFRGQQTERSLHTCAIEALEGFRSSPSKHPQATVLTECP